MLSSIVNLLKERGGGHRVSIQPGDMWFQDFLAAGKHKIDR